MASGGAEDADNQSRKISRSITQGDLRWSLDFRKLNRQIPELKHPLSFRKQTTANCSNRQKIQFRKNQISTQKLRVSSRTSSLTEESSLHISNRELLGLEILQLIENEHLRPDLIANFEPNHFPVFQAGCSK